MSPAVSPLPVLTVDSETSINTQLSAFTYFGIGISDYSRWKRPHTCTKLGVAALLPGAGAPAAGLVVPNCILTWVCHSSSFNFCCCSSSSSFCLMISFCCMLSVSLLTEARSRGVSDSMGFIFAVVPVVAGVCNETNATCRFFSRNNLLFISLLKNIFYNPVPN